MESFVCNDKDLTEYGLVDWEPVRFFEEVGDVIKLFDAGHKPSSSILGGLNHLKVTPLIPGWCSKWWRGW